MDKNHYWTAFKYTKLLQFQTTPALRDSDGNTAVSMKAKEALVRKSSFPKLLTNFIELLVISCGLAPTKIIEKVVAQALVTQAATKAPGLNKINFQVLQMIWN